MTRRRLRTLLLEAGGSDPIAIGRPGTLIGALHIAEYHDRDALLTPGAQIVLYTDGVCEARRETEFSGEERLGALIASRAESAATTTDAVLGDVLAFEAGQPRDDIAVFVLRVTHPRPMPQGEQMNPYRHLINGQVVVPLHNGCTVLHSVIAKTAWMLVPHGDDPVDEFVDMADISGIDLA